jgi:hypothetical protein
MAEPGRRLRAQGAGRGGGLLFLAVGLFLAYLVITTVAGVLKFLLGAALVVVLILLAINVLRRR